jgi:hypothetical protein
MPVCWLGALLLSQPHLLQTQYRMHPAIAEFPSAAFYSDRLLDGIAAADRALAATTSFPWPPASPVAYVPCDDSSSKEQPSGDDSFINRKEAAVVKAAVDLLRLPQVMPRGVRAQPSVASDTTARVLDACHLPVGGFTLCC